MSLLQSAPVRKLPSTPPMSHPHQHEGGCGSGPVLNGPYYVRRGSWFHDFFGKPTPIGGCQGCSSSSYSGWIQRQIEMPGRVKRWLLWWINLIPRGAEFLKVMTGGFVTPEEHQIRQGHCQECRGSIKRLKLKNGIMQETGYCLLCRCPKWFLSRNNVANWFRKRGCPLGLHPKKDENAIFTLYVEEKKRQFASTAPIDREPDPTPAPPPISNCQCDKKSKVRGSGGRKS